MLTPSDLSDINRRIANGKFLGRLLRSKIICLSFHTPVKTDALQWRCVCPPSGCRVVSCCWFHSARLCGARSVETGPPLKCISFRVFTLWATFLPHLLQAMYVPCTKTTKSSADRKPQACGTSSAHHLNQAFLMIEAHLFWCGLFLEISWHSFTFSPIYKLDGTSLMMFKSENATAASLEKLWPTYSKFSTDLVSHFLAELHCISLRAEISPDLFGSIWWLHAINQRNKGTVNYNRTRIF